MYKSIIYILYILYILYIYYILYIWGVLKMGDPQVAMGFNTKSCSPVTWTVTGAPR